MDYKIVNGRLYSTSEVKTKDLNYKLRAKLQSGNDGGFKTVLDEATRGEEQFKVSSHAADRIKERNISLSKSDMDKINEGINKAEEKGAKESVILYKELVMIASIKNRTIVTAMGKNEAQHNVFTNVDSVVLI